MSSLCLEKGTHVCTLAPTQQPNTGLSYRPGIPAPRPIPSLPLRYEPDRGWESHSGLNRDTLPRTLLLESPQLGTCSTPTSSISPDVKLTGNSPP